PTRRSSDLALCEDSDWGSIWGDVIQHRFATDGDLDGHALGNLLIVALWQILEDPVEGLDQMAELLGARGRVLPMALDPLDIEAHVRGEDGQLHTVSGQWQVATAAGRVEDVRLIPARPRVPQDVIDALGRADWIIVGPGSWYTSVLPHLMIPEIAEAIRTSPARRCITTNLSVGAQEAEGMTSLDMLDGLLERAQGCRFDALLAAPTTLGDALELAESAQGRGIRTLLRQVSVGNGTPQHDPVRLAAAYRDLFDDVYGDVETEPAASVPGDGAHSPAGQANVEHENARHASAGDRTTGASSPRTEEDTHGAAGCGQGGAEPPRGDPSLRAQGGGGGDAPLRRRAASGGRTGGGRGGAGLRGRRPPAPRDHRRHVRAPRGSGRPRALRHPPHHALHRAGRARGRDARQADRSAGRPRPARARHAAVRGGRGDG